MDNVEITSEDLNELRQINPLAVAQLHNIALARMLAAKDHQIESLAKNVTKQMPLQETEVVSGTPASKDKWWLADKKLLEDNRSKIEGFDT